MPLNLLQMEILSTCRFGDIGNGNSPKLAVLHLLYSRKLLPFLENKTGHSLPNELIFLYMKFMLPMNMPFPMPQCFYIVSKP